MRDLSMSEHSIRTCSPEDIAYLADIERAAARLFPADKSVNSEQTLPDAILRKALREKLLFVADLNQALVGFAVCEEQDSYLHLKEVSVHPEVGRKGIGRSLVSYVIETSANRGLHGVTLTTFSDVPWNQPFYSKLGFNMLVEENLPAHLITALKHERDQELERRVGMVFTHEC